MENNNSSKRSYILGASIILAALALGLMLVCTVRTLKSFDNTVKVRGLCEREVPADRVVYHITYRQEGNSIAELRSVVEQRNASIVAKLRKAGIVDSEIAVANTSIDDRYSYNSDISRVTYRYSAYQNINVFTTKMDTVRMLQKTLEADMLKENAIISTYADYQYRGLNDIKPSMISESLENARAAADEFAKNSHSRIGKMRTASQGVFEIDDLDENTPQVKKVRVVTTVEYYLK